MQNGYIPHWHAVNPLSCSQCWRPGSGGKHDEGSLMTFLWMSDLTGATWAYRQQADDRHIGAKHRQWISTAIGP